MRILVSLHGEASKMSNSSGFVHPELGLIEVLLSKVQGRIRAVAGLALIKTARFRI